jgi:hypothetical protein
MKLLQQTLILGELAIQAYGDRPLGQSLAKTIILKVEDCRTVLQKLLDRVGGTRQLNSVSIDATWASTWWNRWDEDELALLRTGLCRVRNSLDEVLLALDLYVFLSFATLDH